MNGQADIWQFLAGLGFFLYGMHLIDSVIRRLEGRSIKLFLKKHTGSRAGAVFSGLLITAVLQSSSIVNLLLLSFSGAGLVGLRNALGVVLGSNIGGTVNSWLVAALGFKADLDSYGLALIAAGGVGLYLMKEHSRWHRTATFSLGLGLILLGLTYARESMEGMLQAINLGDLAGYPLLIYLLVGFVITAIVQTSAATVMIVLSALYSGAMPLDAAISIVLGAELGTTMKIVLGSIKGAAIKRRIATANVLMNVTSTAIGFVFMTWIIVFLQKIGLHDPLFILVAFQSTVNVIGATLFFFLLTPLSDLLGRFFSEDTRLSCRFLPLASADLPQPAMALVEKEVRYFLLRALAYAMKLFGTDASHLAREFLHRELQSAEHIPRSEPQYEDLKKAEDELIAFNGQLRKNTLTPQTAQRLNQLLLAVRNGMYAAKALKDIDHNIRSLRSSADEEEFVMYQHFREEMRDFMDKWEDAWKAMPASQSEEKLKILVAAIEKDHSEDAAAIYGKLNNGSSRYSTLLNVNREMYNANKSLISALRELSEGQMADAELVPAEQQSPHLKS